MKKIITVLIAVLTLTVVHAQDYSLFKKYQFIQSGDTLPYRLLLPENFDPQKKYPLVLFLHGRGESGDDNEAQLLHGGALFLKEANRKKFPAIVVFPQNAVRYYWSNVQTVADSGGKRSFYFVKDGPPSPSLRLVMELLGNLNRQYKIKEDQVYVMGLSMGGMGTFEIVNRMPHTFAAAIPICGGANTGIAPNLKNTAWWVFHGGKDNVVLPEYSQKMVEAMKANGIPVRFTVYPEAGHNSWDAAFAEPGLLNWLFSKKQNHNFIKPSNN
ncbi:prolyl oligopeptidase family serine peptidase [Niabella beijingensis]|uniref:carboxylesterase family protein n=1 Tax=Niabella beijingensis TaxID=2872700 RepID=UPI001CC15402|nr:prolyl oligopeptidase family serine peptidase [Niabella beijingensis]MBZ4189123.1 dienelactone hydrolase family protein [Niabella beijingensis]